jgi:hypothetical protein
VPYFRKKSRLSIRAGMHAGEISQEENQGRHHPSQASDDRGNKI